MGSPERAQMVPPAREFLPQQAQKHLPPQWEIRPPERAQLLHLLQQVRERCLPAPLPPPGAKMLPERAGTCGP